mgnify:CR=1 FL=1
MGQRRYLSDGVSSPTVFLKQKVSFSLSKSRPCEANRTSQIWSEITYRTILQAMRLSQKLVGGGGPWVHQEMNIAPSVLIRSWRLLT